MRLRVLKWQQQYMSTFDLLLFYLDEFIRFNRIAQFLSRTRLQLKTSTMFMEWEAKHMEARIEVSIGVICKDEQLDI